MPKKKPPKILNENYEEVVQVDIQLDIYPDNLPTKATEKSSGFDLRAKMEEPLITLQPGRTEIINTGVRLRLPQGFEAQIRSRSGLAAKKGLIVLNSPGTIDEDFTGEIKVILHNTSKKHVVVNRHDRIAQMVIVPVPQVTLRLVDDIKPDETPRGDKGLGSTGEK